MAIKDLPPSMLAAEVHEFNKPYVIHQIPTPNSVGPYDLLLRTAVASFCHTDALYLEGGMEPKPSGHSGSHEPTGTVVDLGSACSALGFHIGDRIAALGWRDPCGQCEDCSGPASGHHYCKFMKGFVGMTLPGAFQEYTIVDARFATALPDGLSFATAAPLTCAGATSWRAVKATRAKKGDWLGMVGSGGGLGHLAIQFAKNLGFRVLGVDARDEGISLSRKVGADAVLDARVGRSQLVEAVKAVTGGDLMFATIVLSDHETATDTSCAITRSHGQVIQVAQPARVSVDFKELVFRDIHLEGSLLASQQELIEMIHFVLEKKIIVETHIFEGLNSLPSVVETAHGNRSAGKLVVVVDTEAVAEDKKRNRW